MRFFLTTTALGLAAFAASGAAAQDGSSASQSWTGPYIGGQLGYGWQPKDGSEGVSFDRNADGQFGDSFPAFTPGFCGGAATSTGPGTGCAKDSNGTSWKVHAGFDYQFGETSGPVVGVVAEYGRAKLRDSVTAFSVTPHSYTITARLKDQGSVRARAGYAFQSGTLVYGTGGLAYGKIRNSFDTTNTIHTFTPDGAKKDAWGYNYGGGIEQKVGPFSVGAVYLLNVLKNNKYTVNAAGGPFGTGGAASTDFKRDFSKFAYHTVAATVSYRF